MDTQREKIILAHKILEAYLYYDANMVEDLEGWANYLYELKQQFGRLV
jgi:hypothetical protein